MHRSTEYPVTLYMDIVRELSRNGFRKKSNWTALFFLNNMFNAKIRENDQKKKLLVPLTFVQRVIIH